MCGTQPPIVGKYRRGLLGLLRVESGMEPPERVDGFVGHSVGGGDGARVDQLVHLVQNRCSGLQRRVEGTMPDTWPTREIVCRRYLRAPARGLRASGAAETAGG